MTIRDPEVLEALRDEPELLAVADAITETQRAPRGSHRRVLSRATALVLVGAAVLLAVLLWPSDGGRNRILDRALAAIGNGPVLHLVTRMPTGQELLDLRTGRTIVPTFEIESWSDRNLMRFHLLYRQHGRILGELLFPQDRTPGLQVGNIDPSYTALWTGYRKALASGTAKIIGKGSVYGLPVYWLRFSARGTEVAIDRKSYELVAFRSGRVVSRVLLARTEAFNGSAFKRLTSRPDPFSGVGSGSTGTVSPVGPSKPGNPWLRAGSSIAGLKLASVQQTQTVTNGTKTTYGFELVYGTEGAIRRSLTVDEEKRPAEPADWRGIPKGFAQLSVGGGSDSNNRSYPVWTGYLVVRGVYVTITTGVSRAALLEAARALR
jgi:hypothetical protein